MAAAPDLPEWALGWDAEVAEDDAREAAESDNTSLPVLAIDIVKPPKVPKGAFLEPRVPRPFREAWLATRTEISNRQFDSG